MSDDLIERKRKQYERRLARQSRRGPQCEVITCGKKGPMQCAREARKIWRVGSNGRRLICQFHFQQARHRIAFTHEDAIRLYRSQPERLRLFDIEQAEEVRT